MISELYTAPSRKTAKRPLLPAATLSPDFGFVGAGPIPWGRREAGCSLGVRRPTAEVMLQLPITVGPGQSWLSPIYLPESLYDTPFIFPGGFAYTTHLPGCDRQT